MTSVKLHPIPIPPNHTFGLVLKYVGGWDSAVGIATCYGLGVPGVESHPVSYIMGTRSFLGVKWPGRGADHPPTSSAEVEGRVELYIHSLSGPLWPILGRTLPPSLLK